MGAEGMRFFKTAVPVNTVAWRFVAYEIARPIRSW